MHSSITPTLPAAETTAARQKGIGGGPSAKPPLAEPCIQVEVRHDPEHRDQLLELLAELGIITKEASTPYLHQHDPPDADPRRKTAVQCLDKPDIQTTSIKKRPRQFPKSPRSAAPLHSLK